MWDMCQMPNIWHISHTKHKKQLPSDVAYVPKLYHLCSYRFKFATVWTDVVNQNNVFYLAFSLLSLLVLIFSLSLLKSNPALPSTEKEQNDTPIGSEEKQIIFMGEATLIGSSPSSSSSEAQAAWARPLQSSPSSLSSSSLSSLPIVITIIITTLISPISLSLFWWLVVLIVGGWLILVDGGRLIGLWVWDLGWVWDFGWWCFFFFCVGVDIGCSVCLSFFFFFW